MQQARRRFLQLAGTLAMLAAAPRPARAQGGYPSRPVRFIVGQAAGSSSDITARLIAQSIECPSPADRRYGRVVAVNCWRTISNPPHDYPLAVCDRTSIAPAACREWSLRR